jgi:cytochrome c peroxidase
VSKKSQWFGRRLMRLAAVGGRLSAAAAFFCLSACGGGGSSDEAAPTATVRELLKLPSHFSEPAIPAYNRLTAEKIALGRRLFYDQRLSGNQTQSCDSCHFQDLAFADGKPVPKGSTGDVLRRNSMGLANVAYFTTYTWGNNVLRELEDQIHVPIESDNPIELGVLDGNRDIVLGRFAADDTYRQQFAAAFPDGGTLVTVKKIIYALASFCRTMISGNSAYDRYYLGDKSALTPQQVHGLQLFNSERFECFHCHSGVNFTISYRDFRTTSDTIIYPFFNNGLYNIGGDGSYPLGNQGVFELTQDIFDRGLFRPQSLRNVAVTAPYMHDGSIPTLRDVVLHYVRGGRLIESGPYAGDGRLSPLKSGLVRGVPDATADEVDDVVAFLESLTDQSFVANPDLADPF